MQQSTGTDLRNVEDGELLRAIVRRQLPAFSELYDRYSGRLFGLALKILQNRNQAEDVIQDVFTNVWNKANSYQKQRGSVLTWLMVMCRNRCIDIKRSSGTRKQYISSGTLEIDQLPGQQQKDPLEQTSDRQKSAIVREALQSLPDEQRQLIELSYFGGFSQTEIAGRLELPLGTIKTRIRLAMQKLRRIFVEVENHTKHK